MVRDDRKLVVVQGAATKPVVRVFTAAGRALAAFVWDRGRIAGMGWSSQEDLLIVEDTGQVCCVLLCPSQHETGIHGSSLPRYNSAVDIGMQKVLDLARIVV